MMRCLHYDALLLCCFVSLLHGQTLLWSNEFNGEKGSQPSVDEWTFGIGSGRDEGLIGWGNKESQFYTDSADNVAMDGEGHLVITVRERNSSWDKSFCDQCDYTSAKLRSKRAIRYGRVEARIKLPWGKGLWPAFWLLGANNDCVGWPYSGEMDIMEMKGSRSNSVQGSLHGPGYSGDNAMSATFTLLGGQTFEEDFHLFAIDWEANRIVWSVDDDVYLMRTPDDLGDYPWVFDHDFNVILNLAVGGTSDDKPDKSVEFPKMMLVDYVRVYDKIKPVSFSYSVLNSIKTNFGNLVWSCDFNEDNGTAPDDSQWNYDLGTGNPDGWGNAELQYYTNDTSNCATDGDGHLIITASNRTTQYICRNAPCVYTSARLTTRGKFSHTYGRFEARLKMPSGQGLWPAFWLLGDNFEQVGWPACGAIVYEMRGSDPSSVTFTIHGPDYSNVGGIQTKYPLPAGKSFADDFHVLTIDWQPFRIKASVDGNTFTVMTREKLQGRQWVFDHSFRILLNMAVGGMYDGVPNNDTKFPNFLYVDYIKVYDQGDVVPSNVDPFVSYNGMQCPN